MMENRSCFEEARRKLFSSLFGAEWRDKQIWEYVRDGELTATPAFEGALYRSPDTKIKIMFVGRDLNGWDQPLGDCATLDNAVASITSQTGAFETFVDERGFGAGPRKYYHKNAKFFRFIKHLLEFLGESDADIEKTFYHDSKQWNQKFVWANLYCIAPRNPASSEDAHPENEMVKLGINEYVDLIKLYVDYYKPDVVVFITDIYGWFIRWQRRRSFKDITSDYQEIPCNNAVVARGMIGNSKVVVCKRPDKRGSTYEEVAHMAKTVSEWILHN